MVSYVAFNAITVPAMPPAAAALEAPQAVQQHNVTAGAEAAVGPATQVKFADAADSVVTSSMGHQIVEGGLSIDIVAAEAAAQQASEQPSQYAVKGIIDPQSQLFSGRLSAAQHHPSNQAAVLGPVALVGCIMCHSCSRSPVTLAAPNSKLLRASLSSSFSTILMPSLGGCPEHFVSPPSACIQRCCRSNQSQTNSLWHPRHHQLSANACFLLWLEMCCCCVVCVWLCRGARCAGAARPGTITCG